jgi:hypothetical protein
LSGDFGSGPLLTMVTDKPSIESKFSSKKTIWWLSNCGIQMTWITQP